MAPSIVFFRNYAAASSRRAGVRVCRRRHGLRPSPISAPRRSLSKLHAFNRCLPRSSGAPHSVPTQGPRRTPHGRYNGGPTPSQDHPGRYGCAGAALLSSYDVRCASRLARDALNFSNAINSTASSSSHAPFIRENACSTRTRVLKFKESVANVTRGVHSM